MSRLFCVETITELPDDCTEQVAVIGKLMGGLHSMLEELKEEGVKFTVRQEFLEEPKGPARAANGTKRATRRPRTTEPAATPPADPALL